MSATQTQKSVSNYFDHHSTGFGILRRVRKVTPKGPKGSKDSYWAAEIAAMSGEKGNIRFLNYDTNAVSSQAETLLKDLEERANNKDLKVMVMFKVGDPYIDQYTVTKGPSIGQIRTVMKARLLAVKMAWVKDLTIDPADEEAGWLKVYEMPPKESALAETEKTGTNG